MSQAPRPARDARPFWIGLAGLILVAAAIEAVVLFGIVNDQQAVGGDLRFYQSLAQRWVDSGVYYTDRQLAGPYQVQTEVDNLYPPHALYLFVPFLVVPSVLWWIIPLGLIAYVVWWCRPAVIAWPLLALILLFPKTPTQILYGNTDIWLAAFIAAGVRWGWPAILMSIKPSLAIFGAIGIRTRRWWIAALVLAVLSLPPAALWLDYPTITRNSNAGWYYSFGNLPFFVLPIVAWVVSTRRSATPVLRWTAALLTRGADPAGAPPPGEPSARHP